MSDTENAVLPVARKRKAYTREEKLEIVNYAKDNNIVLAAEQYGVDRTIIGRWHKAEDTLKGLKEGSKRRAGGGRGRKDEREEVATGSDHNRAEGFEEPVEGPSPAPLEHLPGDTPPQSPSASVPVPSVAAEVPQPVLELPEWLCRLIREAAPQPSSSSAAPGPFVADEFPQPLLAPPLLGEAPPQASSSSAPGPFVADEFPQPLLAPPLLGEAPPQASSSSAPVPSVASEFAQSSLAPPLLGEAPPQASSSSAPGPSVAANVPQPVLVPPEETPDEPLEWLRRFFLEAWPAPSAADVGAVYAKETVTVYASPKKSSGGAPVERNGEEEYEVEAICTHRWVKHSRGRLVQYWVKWRDHEKPTWEKASAFVHAKSILEEYRAANNLL